MTIAAIDALHWLPGKVMAESVNKNVDLSGIRKGIKSDRILPRAIS